MLLHQLPLRLQHAERLLCGWWWLRPPSLPQVGHALGLRHDGDASRSSGTTLYAYLFGLPRYDTLTSGATRWPYGRRWNTIMGGSLVNSAGNQVCLWRGRQ